VNPQELVEEIAIELEALEITVDELLDLQRDVADREPTTREKTAAAAFLAQFYNGIENILKRISLYHGIPLPIGETWHTDLFQRFCSPSYSGLPSLFDRDLADDMAPYRRFRHIVFHSYGFQVGWNRMAEGIAGVQGVFSRFKTELSSYLANLDN